MIVPGLVSVSFRQLKPREIVNLVTQANLCSIEWGGDIHVPHGNEQIASEVACMTTAAGLSVAAYGSYYRVGEKNEPAFDAIVATAHALAAPTIRVWAGGRSSTEADVSYRMHVVDESRRIADMAMSAGMTISFECHSDTLTDTNLSAHQLMNETSHPGVRCYWQPAAGASESYCLDGLAVLLPWLTNVHVFHWWPAYERLPLVEGQSLWMRYLHKVMTTGRDHHALLEFVKDDAPDNLIRDAATLVNWLQNAGSSE